MSRRLGCRKAIKDGGLRGIRWDPVCCSNLCLDFSAGFVLENDTRDIREVKGEVAASGGWVIRWKKGGGEELISPQL